METTTHSHHPVFNFILWIFSSVFFISSAVDGEEWRVWTTWALGMICSIAFLIINHEQILEKGKKLWNRIFKK